MLKQKGAPTRTTKGAIGDLYVDLNTGKEYKCTFAYQDSTLDRFDYEWKPTGRVLKEDTPKETPKQEPEKEPETEALKPEPKPEKKTDYTAYSKKGK